MISDDLDLLKVASISTQESPPHIRCKGDWILSGISTLPEEIAKVKPRAEDIVIDTSGISSMDSGGAWLLQELLEKLKEEDKKVSIQGLRPEHQSLLALVSDKVGKISKVKRRRHYSNLFYVIGKATVAKYVQARDFTEFLGEFVIALAKSLRKPHKIQWRALLNTIDEAGYQALGIVALLTFLIGIVLCYQMGQQLRVYGANIYIVSLLGIAVMQEFAPLITAIILAGRTSSAFTAQIGTMKINEEIDALRTMGLSPLDHLVTPKILALLIIMPLLTVWADIFGLLGGMIMSKRSLGVNYYEFIVHFPKVVLLKTYLNGLIKAPVFACIIGMVGCFQGFQVTYTADSVGKQTTRSVVQAIFFIIIADSIFSILQTWQEIL
jgi:phospholipid/cholesterol/gamma-HCH transport system permease protein